MILTEAGIWIRANVKWLGPFLAAIVQAVRPVFISGQHYTLPQWVSVAVLLMTAASTYVVPNVEQGIAVYAKAIVTLLIATAASYLQVAPGGISRADVWTIGTAAAAVIWAFIWPTTQPKAVQAGGPGYLGDTAPVVPAPEPVAPAPAAPVPAAAIPDDSAFPKLGG